MHELIASPIVHAIIVFAVCLLCAKFFYRTDERIENRRRAAFALAGELKAQGMTWVPDLLEDYAVGDYDSIGTKMVKIAELAKNDPAMKAEFHAVFVKLLKSKFQDADAKKELEGMLEGLGHKLVPVTPTASPDLLDQMHTKIVAAVSDAVAAIGNKADSQAGA
jgi:hypothetical protein